MPRGDRTGPEGLGAMTGRGLGFCNGNQTPGFNRGFGRGAGGGFGRGLRRATGYGLGQGRGYYRENLPEATVPESQNSLKSEAASLMERLKKVLDALDKSASNE